MNLEKYLLEPSSLREMRFVIDTPTLIQMIP